MAPPFFKITLMLYSFLLCFNNYIFFSFRLNQTPSGIIQTFILHQLGAIRFSSFFSQLDKLYTASSTSPYGLFCISVSIPAARCVADMMLSPDRKGKVKVNLRWAFNKPARFHCSHFRGTGFVLLLFTYLHPSSDMIQSSLRLFVYSLTTIRVYINYQPRFLQPYTY